MLVSLLVCHIALMRAARDRLNGETSNAAFDRVEANERLRCNQGGR